MSCLVVPAASSSSASTACGSTPCARLPTPQLDALARQGFLAPVGIEDDTPTMSGPCWATVVTGVTVAKHGVWSNDFTGHRLAVFPDFATRLAEQDGGRTFVAVEAGSL